MRHTTVISLTLAVLTPISNCASIGGDAGRLTARTADPLSSPPAVGATTVNDYTAAWDAAYTKAAAAVKKLSIIEKSSLTTGGGFGASVCSGTIYPIATIGFKGLCLEDGPMSMRPAEKTTVFPAGINTAASFNRALIRSRGVAMGSEFKAKGVNVAFAPAINMLRAPDGGRGWESFGADPFLTGVSGYETVLGLQSTGVQANAKHLVGNEQEYQRFTSDSIITDRVLHEVYLHPFLMTMVAGVSSLMCALNSVNGDFACGNGNLQNNIVRKLYGYRGYILSDWLAAHGTSDAFNGLEVTMPGNAGVNSVPLSGVVMSPNGESFFGPNITLGVASGTFPVSRLDEMATRVLAGYYLLKQDSNTVTPDYTRDVRSTANTKVARDLAAASIVLLKNVNKALPLSASKLTSGMAVLGSDARLPTTLNAGLGAVNDGTLFFGWGSGSATLTTASAPADALAAQAKTDKTAIVTNFDDWNVQSAAAAAKGKSAAIVFVKTMSGEGHIVAPVEFAADGINPGDRSNISAWNNGDNLIKAVAAVNKNTIVVVHSVGQMDLEAWIDNANITAVVWAGVPGQESGNALVDVLYGKVNPSGRLPYTIAKKFSDYPARTSRVGGHNDPTPIKYTEGLLVDYRHFDSKNITPRFAFGFGLSYTTFAYSGISVTKGIQPPTTSAAVAWMNGQTACGDGVSTQPWMHTKALTVSFTLKNSGSVAGTEIPQLYLAFPSGSGEPPRVLRGFESVSLAAGANKTVSITLTPMMLSIWDTSSQGWKRPSGTFIVNIGSSSRDILLTKAAPSLP